MDTRRQESRILSIAGGLIFPQHLLVDFVRDNAFLSFLFKFDVDVKCFDLVLCLTRDGENLFFDQNNIADHSISNNPKSDNIKTFTSDMNYTSICGNLSFEISLQKRGEKRKSLI